jgi:hypothetical protein
VFIIFLLLKVNLRYLIVICMVILLKHILLLLLRINKMVESILINIILRQNQWIRIIIKFRITHQNLLSFLQLRNRHCPTYSQLRTVISILRVTLFFILLNRAKLLYIPMNFRMKLTDSVSFLRDLHILWYMTWVNKFLFILREFSFYRVSIFFEQWFVYIVI